MSESTSAPARPAGPGIRELTVRAIVLGGLITLVFTAANAYIGLKVGLTFATAIPAAVISMAVLRAFSDHSIVENNIVQTVASAAGTLSAIIFVIPGLVMIGWWVGFPYWTTLAVCAVGGVLGVMYSIPLRRALVTGSDLPYPEGVAAAEVLKVGETSEGAQSNKAGLWTILIGTVASALFALLAKMRLVSDSLSAVYKIGTGGSMFGASLSLALIGIGHLVGITVGIAMLVGLVISFVVLLPIRTWGDFTNGPAIGDVISSAFSGEVRLIGAGAIAIAAIWTLVKIMGPIITGIRNSMTSMRSRQAGVTVDITERDIPITYVGGTVLVLMIPIGFMLWDFVQDTSIAHSSAALIITMIVFVIIAGLLIAAVCGYMAGLIGSSNSPISGVGILVVLIAAILVKLVFGSSDDDQTLPLVAFTLFTASIVFGIATISNDNLQDLKTGQLVGATPWKQQVALIIGVMFGAAIIPPVLGLMSNAFGFAGAPGAGEDALAAPQARLMSDLATGVLGGSLDWGLLGIGALIGVGVIIVDEVLGKTSSRLRLPPLAVGMGMYLPMSLTLIIPIGAFLGVGYNKWAERSGGNVEHKKRIGVLMATGLIVGESLFGVVFAGIVAISGRDDTLNVVGESFDDYAKWLGLAVFILFVVGLYRWAQRIADTDPESKDTQAKV